MHCFCLNLKMTNLKYFKRAAGNSKAKINFHGRHTRISVFANSSFQESGKVTGSPNALEII